MKNCHHCKQEIPKNINISEEVDNNKYQFCCNGCLGVYLWIKEENLEQYYKVRSSAPKADNIDLAKYELFDLPEIYQKYTYQNLEKQNSENKILTEVNINIKGIHCPACMWLIEKSLLKNKSIISAQGNASTFSLNVIWDNSKIKLSKILITIARLGYIPELNSLGNNKKEDISKEKRKTIKRLIVSALGMMQVMMFSAGLYVGDWQSIDPAFKSLLQWVSFLVTTPVYFYAGMVFVISAIKAIKNKNLNMDVPVAIAITLAYIFSIYHLLKGQGNIYFDTVVMFIFFLSASRYLEVMSRHKAELYSLQNQAILPEIVIKIKNKTQTPILLDLLKVGDIILVKSGETIGADGVVISGKTTVNQSLLTGEDKSIIKKIGNEVFAGTLNQEQIITIKVTAVLQNTTLAKTKQLLNKAQIDKPKTAIIADRVAKYIVGFILISTVLSYIVWEFILGSDNSFEIALSVLVATCPCALSLAVPAAYTASANALARNKLFIKNNDVFDKIKNLKHIIFDKTGTLTTSNIKLDKINLFSKKYTEKQILEIVASMEKNIHHPIANAFKNFIHQNINVNDVKIISGKGIKANYQQTDIYLGSYNFMQETEHNLSINNNENNKNLLFLADKKQILASFKLKEQTSTYAKEAISNLSNYNLYIASGDSKGKVEKIAKTLGIRNFYHQMLAKDKLDLLKKLRYSNNKPSVVMMVGDGVNDAPVLAGADISIAVADASSLSKSNSDIVLLNNDLRLVYKFIKIAQKTRKVILQNITWAICYNLVAIPLAILGYLPPWVAAIGMSLSSLFVTLNAIIRIR